MSPPCHLPQEGLHADGSSMPVALEAARHPERSRYYIRLRLVKPTSSLGRATGGAAPGQTLGRPAEARQNTSPGIEAGDPDEPDLGAGLAGKGLPTETPRLGMAAEQEQQVEDQGGGTSLEFGVGTSRYLALRVFFILHAHKQWQTKRCSERARPSALGVAC